MAINNPVVTDADIIQDTAVAIQEKDHGGKMEFPDFPSRIRALPSPALAKNMVNFYDFKGNLGYSYTADEAEALTELPEAPVIEGFTFQKWNWSLSSIKTWLVKHKNDNCELNVGGLYATSDGHTRIHMRLREAKLASLEMPFCIQQMAGTVIIDWGDESESETITSAGIYSHLWQVNSYPTDVVIDIEYTPSGPTKLVLGRAVGATAYGLFNNEPYYAGCVKKVEYGNNNDFSAYSATFKSCTHLKSINIPFGIGVIGRNAFSGCTNLALLVLPDSITSIDSSAFQNCTNLSLPILPDGITSIADAAFQNCTNLALTVLPDGITNITSGAFRSCTNLALNVLPDGITSIDANAFNGCTNLALTALPDGITSITSGVFNGCANLALTALPDGITSIGSYAFNGCTNLALIVLPDGITSIDANAFTNCKSLYVIDLTAFTDPLNIPALQAVNVFSGIPVTARFLVYNQEMHYAFTAATNWSTYASKFTIGEA